jgi:hypothetical protein
MGWKMAQLGQRRRPEVLGVTARGLVFCCALLASLSSTVCPSFSQVILDDFFWGHDPASNRELAISRNETPINYIVVGDLSQFSLHLINQYVRALSEISGLPIDRKYGSVSLAIVHDTKVFDRLKNDRKSFAQLGISESSLDVLASKAVEGTRCAFSSFVSEKQDINATVILLSEQFDDCLINGLFHNFGVVRPGSELKSIMSVCLLYQARRLGRRAREEFSGDVGAIIEPCMKKSLGRN